MLVKVAGMSILLCGLYCPLFIEDTPLGWSCALGTNVLGNKQYEEAKAHRASSVAITSHGTERIFFWYFIHMGRMESLFADKILKIHFKQNCRLARLPDALPN